MPKFLCVSLVATALRVATALPAHAQNQVANYAVGQPGTPAYEHFSFWIKDNHRTDIQYAYGAKRTDARPRYVGPVRLHGQAGFKVAFSNNRTLYIVPSGLTLRVSTSPTAAPKTFTWEYEGPVNGVGTNCSVCVADATAALRLIQRHYLR